MLFSWTRQTAKFKLKIGLVISCFLVVSLAAALLGFLPFLPSVAKAATTYEVGPGKPYSQISQVAALVQPGDLVLVYANGTTPYKSVTFGRTGTGAAPITVRGVRDPISGQRPIISDSTDLIVVFTAGFYILEGFEITTSSSTNSMIIAMNPFKTPENTNRDIIIRDSLIRDCPGHGILSNDDSSGTIILSHIEVARCGNGTYEHAIYVTTGADFPTAVFRLEYSYIHDSRGGNLVKSRSKFNQIYYNWLESGADNGSIVSYHELELIGPDNGTGGSAQDPRHSDVVGNVLVKKNAFGSSVRIGGDGTGASYGQYRFLNNTFVLNNATSPKNVIRVMDQVRSLEMENNIFTSRTSGGINTIRDAEAQWLSNPRPVAGKNNWVAPASTVASEFQATVVGGSNDPGFVDYNNYDVRLKGSSSAANAGTNSPVSPGGLVFPLPFTLPTTSPPLRQAKPLSSVDSRPQNGVIDIGAFEAAAAPTLNLSFNPASFQVGTTTKIVYTLNNPNPVTLSGVGFGHTLPSQLKIATNPSLTNSCSVAGTVQATPNTGAVTASGVSLSPNQTCVISLQITSSSVGSFATQTGQISSSETGSGAVSNSATVQVTALPAIAGLSFNPPLILAGATSTLSYVITNPNSVALTSLSFSDTLPIQLAVAGQPNTSNSCGGALSANPGGGQVNLSGATLNANSSCTVSVSLTGNQVGKWSNKLESLSSATTGPGNSGATASLEIVAPIYEANPVSADNVIRLGATKIGTTRELTLTVANKGHPITSFGVTFTLQGANSGVFSLSTTNLLLVGGQSSSVKIGCVPTSAGLVTATLLVATNPGGLAPLGYTLQCWGGSKVVTKNTDDGSLETLSEALSSASSGDVVVFDLPAGNHTISFNQPVSLAVKTGVIVDAGCANGPSVTLDGTNQTEDGLRLSGGSFVAGLKIKGFGSRQLIAFGHNFLSCLAAQK